MMAQPVGSFRSPNHHDVVLYNWAIRRRVKLRFFGGHAGWAFFVNDEGFQIEHRGPSFPPYKYLVPFDMRDRRSRKVAFGKAAPLFLRLSRQERGR